MSLRGMVLSAGVMVGVASALALPAGQPVRTFRPVTDAMLAKPDAGDWLAWRGTSASLGYSPLAQINRGNVVQLRVAWSWAMEPGVQESAPLAHDGIVYLPNPGGIVQALDGATGDLLWEYKPKLPDGARAPETVLRGISLYGSNVYVNQPDGHLVALDAATGRVVWSTQVDPTFRARGASVVARGKVISGLTGCSRFIEEKCAIVAHDAATGKEVWRTVVIPRPGDPGFESWGDLPYLYRSGGDMWIPGSYDHELGLVYWSTSQAKPWASAARGTNGDALYSNSTLALNPDTGKIVWYRQTLPGETHDLDEVFENILVDTGSRKSLFHMGKIGILWEMDRQTGKILRATDMGLQNLVDLDPTTGTVKYRSGRVPKVNEPFDYCPSPLGGKNWEAMAYSPETQALYIPLKQTCVNTTFLDVERKPGGGGTGMGPFKPYVDPRANGQIGMLRAVDVKDGKTLWTHHQHPPFVSSALTTAGGLVFAADYDRYFDAFDAKTGQLLWKARTATNGHGFPMSYQAGGRQFIALPIGVGDPSFDEYGPPIVDLPRPKKGNALVVFELPQP